MRAFNAERRAGAAKPRRSALSAVFGATTKKERAINRRWQRRRKKTRIEMTPNSPVT